LQNAPSEREKSDQTAAADIQNGTFVGLDLLGDSKNNLFHVTQDSQSVASVNANFSIFMRELLCKPIEEYGKLPVMTMSNHGKTPKFNKYPGVIEWNNCLYLWVNIGGKTGYTNTFSEHGRYMMWYGGSKMKSGT
jgi:hypothetical protein